MDNQGDGKSQLPSPRVVEIAESSGGIEEGTSQNSDMNQVPEEQDHRASSSDSSHSESLLNIEEAIAIDDQNRNLEISLVVDSLVRLCSSNDASISSDEDINTTPPSTAPMDFAAVNLELIDYTDSDSDMDIDTECISPLMISENIQSMDYVADAGEKLDVTPSLFKSPNEIDETKDVLPTTPLRRPPELENCKICHQPADFACKGCYRSAYCSEKHQMEDWALHSRDCVHYELIRSPSLLYRGPFSIDAAEDKSGKKLYTLKSKGNAVVANQKLLEEKPFLICPWPRTRIRHTEMHLPGGVVIRNLSCFGCGKTLNFSWTRCQDCNLFLCSAQCLYISNHKNAECKIIREVTRFNSKKLDPRLDLKTLHLNEDYREYLYMDVMIIRLIFKFSELRQSMSPEEFACEWTKLNLIWKSLPPGFVNQRYTKIGDNLQDYLSFSYNLLKGNRNLLLKLFSIIDVNSFSLELPFRRFRALCVVLGLASHSCVPNCQTSLYEPGMEKIDINQIEENPNDLTVVLKTGRGVCDKAILTFSYVPLIFGTEERRQILQSTRFIRCTCLRCMDPTECGTFTTNIKCQACHCAMVLPPKSAVIAVGPDQEFHGLVKPNWECRGNNTVLNKRPTMVAFRRTSSHSRLTFCPSVKHKDAIDKIKGLEAAIAKYAVDSIITAKEFFITARINNNNFYQSALLKLSEDILRGTFFPLPDVLADDLKEYSDQALTAIVLAKNTYLEFMQKVNPGFEFQGFPIANLELAENELLGRESGRIMYVESINPQSRLRGGCVTVIR